MLPTLTVSDLWLLFVVVVFKLCLQWPHLDPLPSVLQNSHVGGHFSPGPTLKPSKHVPVVCDVGTGAGSTPKPVFSCGSFLPTLGVVFCVIIKKVVEIALSTGAGASEALPPVS